MPVSETLHSLGGLARRGQLVRFEGRAAVDRALAGGDIVRVARGRYGLRTLPDAVVAAGRVAGVLGLEHAALHHGWEVVDNPRRPQLVVPKDRRVSEDARSRLDLIWRDLGSDDHDGLATSPALTLDMCSRRLPFHRALAVADSALRAGFRPARLDALARQARGPGSRQLRRVADAARGAAANPFESVLRAIALDVAGLNVTPQVLLTGPGWAIRPDLVDEELALVLEADSFEWHGGRAALDRDATRYNRLVAAGWSVLRFSWEAVMARPEEVRESLVAVVAQRTNRGRRDRAPRSTTRVA